MKLTTYLIGAMAVLSAIAFLPASVPAAPVCVTGNQVCVCTGCPDSATGWNCAAGVGLTNSSMKGLVCTQPPPPPPPPGNGTGSGVTRGISRGLDCDGFTTFTYASDGRSATYSQSFVASSPNVACGGADVSPVYSADDTEFTFSENTLLIRHVSQGAFAPTLETTEITFVQGGAWFDQRFVDVYTGETTWESSGFLAGGFQGGHQPPAGF